MQSLKTRLVSWADASLADYTQGEERREETRGIFAKAAGRHVVFMFDGVEYFGGCLMERRELPDPAAHIVQAVIPARPQIHQHSVAVAVRNGYVLCRDDRYVGRQSRALLYPIQSKHFVLQGISVEVR
jgi:hypothetical protein